MARFNEQGLAALSIAAGRGRQASYTSEQRALILQEVQREPDREQDAGHLVLENTGTSTAAEGTAQAWSQYHWRGTPRAWRKLPTNASLLIT